MTPPRQILADQTFEITVRALARTFRFVPTPRVRQLVLYVLGVAAERYGVSLYGMVLMVNHYHLTGRDKRGVLPEFVQYVNSLVARAINCLQRRKDKVWSGDTYTIVRPQTRDDLLGKIVYGMANPAAAGLVRRASDYPGLIIRPEDIGRDITVERPSFFFRDGGKMPDEVTVRFDVPPEFEHLGRDGYIALLQRELAEREKSHEEARRAEGTAVLGAKRLRRVRVGDRATSYEKWFRLRPTIAAKMREVRVAAIRALVSFRQTYAKAIKRWRAGERDVEFPRGTWWVARYAGATVAAA